MVDQSQRRNAELTLGCIVGHSERAPIHAELGTPSGHRNCDGGPDGCNPEQAHWLSPKEQEWIRGALDSEKSARAARGSFTVVKALRDPDIILMAVSGFFVNVGVIGFGF
jgi:hypothetical protein